MNVTIFIGDEKIEKEDLSKYKINSDEVDRILAGKINCEAEKHVS